MMRRYVLMGLALLAVSSCDSNNPAPKPAAVSCNCTAPATTPQAAPEPAPEPTGHSRGTAAPHHRVASGRARGYRWHRTYAEAAVFTYDYHSDSRSYFLGAVSDRSSDGWHGSHVHAISNDDAKARMKPWHGFDVDCPDDKR